MTFAPQGAIDHIFNCLNRDLICVHVIILTYQSHAACTLRPPVDTRAFSLEKKKAQTELRKSLVRHLSVSSVILALTAYIQIYEQTTAAYGEQGVESNSGQQ